MKRDYISHLPFVILLVLGLFLHGCASAPALTLNRLLPWNMFHPDMSARLEKAEIKNLRAEWASVHAALIESRKAAEALRTAPPSPQVDLAVRFVSNANSLLGQVTPLTAAEDMDLRKIVAGFLSFQPDLVAEAEKKQAALERKLEKLSAEVVKTAAAEEAVTGLLKISNAENAVQASKYRRLWFWIWTAIAIYVLIQILPIISKLFPALTPVAKAASWIAAPAVQAGYSRLRGAVGETLHAAQRVGSMTIDTLRQNIDSSIDVAEQKELAKQFKAAAAANASSS